MSRPDRRGCPFCGSGNLDTISADDGCYVECQDCDAKGPPGESESEAWRRWDERSR